MLLCYNAYGYHKFDIQVYLFEVKKKRNFNEDARLNKKSLYLI